MVDAKAYLDFDPAEVGINEHVYFDVLMEILESTDDENELKVQLETRINELIPKHITRRHSSHN